MPWKRLSDSGPKRLKAISPLEQDLERRQTIEGLASPSGKLHPVQQAFVDELGPQCGFCTPGQVLSAVALLKVNPKPTREEASLAMSGNLCRCGAYDHYLKAIMRVAGGV